MEKDSVKIHDFVTDHDFSRKIKSIFENCLFEYAPVIHCTMEIL